MHELTPQVLPTYETLLLAFEGPIATVTLNRPEVLNALNAQMFTDLEHVFQLLAKNPAIRAILLTGAGPKAFAAGADINELASTDATSAERLALRGQSVMSHMETCGKPVIACINGFALGGGCELALACTLRLASAKPPASANPRSSSASFPATAEPSASPASSAPPQRSN